MRKQPFALALLILVVIAWCGSQSKSPYAADAKPPVQRFEYAQHFYNEIEHIEGQPNLLLKELGDKGWEMCGVVGNSVFFKRPRQ